MEVQPQEGELGALVSSPEFARMVDRFAATTGLRLQGFDLARHPLTAVEDYPRYCRLLQERKACPLYNDPDFLKRGEETIGVCKSGVGHFIAPVRNEKEVQIGAVVGPAVKDGPNSVEEFAELAFRLKIFPDDLIQAADAVQEHDAENLLGAGELVSVGLKLVAAKRRLVEGIAEWVKHADRTVTVPDISKSAWSRYLTDDTVKVGSVVGVPIPDQKGGSTFGAIVVGFDRARDDLEEVLAALESFVAEGLYALVMGRKLMQAEQLALLDAQSGANGSRYLDDLLDKEISRASRYSNDLAIVTFEIEAFEVLRGKNGEAGLGRLLREVVAVIRAKTRRVNTLARICDGQFCLVIPEADRSIAVRQADRLRPALEEHPYAATPNGDIVRLAVDTGVAASEHGKDDRAALLAQAMQSLTQARSERRTRRFNP